MSEYAITVDSVSKTFTRGFWRKKHTEALRSVSLQIKKGEIFGLLGPNGAGKTTLLNILSTQLTADSGEVLILGRRLGRSVGRGQYALKCRMNMCSGNPNFPWSLTVRETLKFYAMLYGLGGPRCERTVDSYIGMLELDEFSDRRYDSLSTGTKQRLALAKSLLNDPEILFLDEPTIGLDPDIARKIRSLILDIHKRRHITILITTHYMREAEDMCERVAFIKGGTIRAVGTAEELQAMTHTADLEGVFLEFAGS
jgi:ABC-2 type transport system ATP-binding protein